MTFQLRGAADEAGWRGTAFLFFLSVCAGAVGALGQAPWDFPLAMLLGLAGAFLLFAACTSPRRAALSGWAFGLGWFAVALHWIVEPFQVDAARHGWMAPFALVLLSGGLALFWGAAFWTARRFSTGVLLLVPVWAAAELVRAYVLTGFPWAAPAQALVDRMAGQGLAFVGPHSMNLAIFALACLPAFIYGRRGHNGQSSLAALIMLAGIVPVVLPVPQGAARMTDHWVRLIQPNAAQHLKWQPENARRFLDLQLALTARPAAGQTSGPDLVIWPETAIAWRLDQAAPVLEAIRSVTDAQVVLGVLRAQEGRLRNSLVHLGPDEGQQIYDKHHLVPFGEYLPLAPLAEALGLAALAQTGPGFAPGPGPAVLDFGALGQGMPLICYEAVFAHDVNAAPQRPAFLLQITNDAWFGQFAGPHQHLAQARMRAIEQGLPVLRAANTGVSAVVDPLGRVAAHLPLGRADALDARVPAPLGPTFYSRSGDIAAVVLLAVWAGVLLLLRFGATKAVQRPDK